ncbi:MULTISPECIES: LysR family transcriptional regulator [unclassified Acidovorax]|uniref:LysR family transcriptional regulator n=1 Tax=unclassified Acidovorax TaxID=2684926 RepID=UPI001C472AA2|nr:MULTISPECIES: LysR family transcriptional regulator [unclassified Acidovorax]MBV7459703.1 LysR family transcriptional regulator [Acidovorax sp. sif0632]MBV7464728.1 LysR family transcriptional regulator [Acidovorax sp. sif0613]
MSAPHLSSRQLDAFLALAEQRSFTRAATLCHLSQPAFSALIRALEDDLGLRLFDRSTRHVDLTPEGKNFLESARRIRAEITSALAAVRDAATLQRGRVAVALLPSLAAGWLPGVLAQYRAAHPGIEIDIADVLSEPCIDRVASGHADFALAAIRADTPALQAEPFCSDNFYLVCPADHLLARRRKAITAQDLAAWPFIHLARTSSVRQYLEAALQPQAMHTLMEVEQLATVMGMVRAGLGISVVPALTLFHFDQPGLVTRPLSLPGLTRQIYLVRRRDESLSVAAQALYALVMAQRP